MTRTRIYLAGVVMALTLSTGVAHARLEPDAEVAIGEPVCSRQQMLTTGGFIQVVRDEYPTLGAKQATVIAYLYSVSYKQADRANDRSATVEARQLAHRIGQVALQMVAVQLATFRVTPPLEDEVGSDFDALWQQVARETEALANCWQGT